MVKFVIMRWTGGRARRCSGNGDERHLVLVLRHGGAEGARHGGGEEELVQAIWGRSAGYSRGRRCCSTLPLPPLRSSRSFPSHELVLLDLLFSPAAAAEFQVVPQARAGRSPAGSAALYGDGAGTSSRLRPWRWR